MSVQAAADLRAARALIERGWCQHMSACDDEWHRTGPKSPDARRWCAVGAISAVTDGCHAAVACDAALRRAMLTASAAFWNDMPGRTQQEVLALFARAIAAEEALP